MPVSRALGNTVVLPIHFEFDQSSNYIADVSFRPFYLLCKCQWFARFQSFERVCIFLWILSALLSQNGVVGCLSCLFVCGRWVSCKCLFQDRHFHFERLSYQMLHPLGPRFWTVCCFNVFGLGPRRHGGMEPLQQPQGCSHRSRNLAHQSLDSILASPGFAWCRTSLFPGFDYWNCPRQCVTSLFSPCLACDTDHCLTETSPRLSSGFGFVLVYNICCLAQMYQSNQDFNYDLVLTSWTAASTHL